VKHLIKTMGAAYVAIAMLWLGGCASTLQWTADTFDVEIVPAKVQQNAYKAALVTFVAWGGAPSEECKAQTKPAEQCIGGVQELIYRYGKLTPCGSTATILCRDDQAWAKIKAVELATSHTLASLEPAIVAGTNDVELMMSLPAVVHDAHAAITKAIKGE
jgi:hypothetical protein